LDYVLEEHLLAAFVEALRDVPVLLCGVMCESEQLGSREAARGDRIIGLAERQARTVHFCSELYDLELDSTIEDADSLAEKIVRYLRENPASYGVG